MTHYLINLMSKYNVMKEAVWKCQEISLKYAYVSHLSVAEAKIVQGHVAYN
jgi:hypothetical protein